MKETVRQFLNAAKKNLAIHIQKRAKAHILYDINIQN